ncbi:hypothetical protein VNI00_018949 [Paramarasmius palmivorus]|uniref:Uncharacterized protein n=1 Tax=Paramarasmius palmivorus TaxID=297713 RepID=A0AAW0AU89_9AGAR
MVPNWYRLFFNSFKTSPCPIGPTTSMGGRKRSRPDADTAPPAAGEPIDQAASAKPVKKRKSKVSTPASTLTSTTNDNTSAPKPAKKTKRNANKSSGSSSQAQAVSTVADAAPTTTTTNMTMTTTTTTNTTTNDTEAAKQGPRGLFVDKECELLEDTIPRYKLHQTGDPNPRLCLLPDHVMIQEGPGGVIKSQSGKKDEPLSSLLHVTLPGGKLLPRKVQTWFYNHHDDVNKATLSGWEPYLKTLSCRFKKPSRKVVFKHYMSHEDYEIHCEDTFQKVYMEEVDLLKAKFGVNDSVVAELEEMPAVFDDEGELILINEDENGVPESPEDSKKQLRKYLLALRCKVAKEIYDAESDDIKAQVEEEVEAIYQERLEQWESAKPPLGIDMSASVIKLRRENFLTSGQKLIDDITALTGFKIVLYCGAPDDGGLASFPVHAGVDQQGLSWEKYDPDAVKKSLKYFFNFVEHCQDNSKTSSGTPAPRTPAPRTPAPHMPPHTPPHTPTPHTPTPHTPTPHTPTPSRTLTSSQTLPTHTPASRRAVSDGIVNMSKGATPLTRRVASDSSSTSPPSTPAPQRRISPLPSRLMGTPARNSRVVALAGSHSRSATPSPLRCMTPAFPDINDPASPNTGLDTDAPTKGEADHFMDDSDSLSTSSALKIRGLQGPPFTAIPGQAEKAAVPSGDSMPIKEKGNQVERIRTLEGGPDRDPLIRKVPSKRPAALPRPAQQKIMSARLLGRLVDYESDKESEMDSDSSEGHEDQDDSDDGPRRSSRLKAKPTSTQLTSTRPRSTQPSSQPSQNNPPSPNSQADNVVDEEDFWGPDPSQNPWLETPPRRYLASTWFNTSIDVLCADEDLMMREIWIRCINGLIQLEESYGYDSPRTGIPRRNRPKSVEWWFQQGRWYRKKPLFMGTSEEFGASLVKWWSFINPDWRIRNEDDTMSREEDEGDWSDLCYPGERGLVVPLMCLRWWYMHEAIEGGSSAWNETATDMAWVLERMTEWSLNYVEEKQMEIEDDEVNSDEANSDLNDDSDNDDSDNDSGEPPTKKQKKAPASQSRPTSTRSKPASTRSKPASTRSKPASTRSKPASTRSRPASTRSKPASTRSKPAPSQASQRSKPSSRRMSISASVSTSGSQSTQSRR